VPVDFESQELASELVSAAFTRTEPAIFVWGGFIVYLTPRAARTTLEYIAERTGPVDGVLGHSPKQRDSRRMLPHMKFVLSRSSPARS